MKLCRLAGLFILVASIVNADDVSRSSSVKESELRMELLQRFKADQDVREAITRLMMTLKTPAGVDEATFESALDSTQKAEFRSLKESIEKTDAENTKRLREIVAKHGWPTKSLVGKDGATAAWLIVQHADHSPEFQRKCLDMIVKLPRGEIRRQDVAYLTDRVLLAEGKKQIYGTQFTLENGKYKPEPLEDESNVDKLRAEVGLPTIREYAKEIEALYTIGPQTN